jgi:hypothetical protein
MMVAAVVPVPVMPAASPQAAIDMRPGAIADHAAGDGTDRPADESAGAGAQRAIDQAFLRLGARSSEEPRGNRRSS